MQQKYLFNCVAMILVCIAAKAQYDLQETTITTIPNEQHVEWDQDQTIIDYRYTLDLNGYDNVYLTVYVYMNEQDYFEVYNSEEDFLAGIDPFYEINGNQYCSDNIKCPNGKLFVRLITDNTLPTSVKYCGVHFFFDPPQISYGTGICYTYDIDGNRIKRELTTVRLKNGAMSEEEVIDDDWKDKRVKLFPNPSKYNLSIQVENALIDERYAYTLYSIEGKPILNGYFYGNRLQKIIMTDLRKGIYMLELSDANSKKVFKIIKE